MATLVTIAVTAALVAFIAWQSHRTVETDARARLAAKAQFVEVQFASLVHGIDATLNQVMQDVGRADYCDQRLLDRLTLAYPEYRAITVMDNHGINRCSSLKELAGLDRSVEDYMKKALAAPAADVLMIAPPLVSRLSGVPILVMHKAAIDGTGKLRAIVQVSIDLHHLDQMLATLREPGQTLSITHDSGLIVSRHPDAKKFRLLDISKSRDSAFSLHQAGREQLSSHRVVAATDGVERLVVFTDVVPKPLALAPRGHLLVGVSEPVADLYAGWLRQTELLFAAWLLLAGTIAGLTARVVGAKRQLLEEIDQQRRALKELRGMTDQLTQQRDALDEHAIVSMADTGGRIVYANDKFCDISGYALKEVLGQNHRIVNSGTHPPEFFREMWLTIAAGHPWHGLICNRARDGRHYWVNSTVVPMRNGEGHIDNYLSIRTDVTGLMEMQETLMHSEQAMRAAKDEAERARDVADAANQQKSAFLASMSHELRTPMNSILGFTQLLQLEKLSTGMREDVEHIHKAGKHLLTLINEVLDLSRIESGQIELSPQVVDIGTLQSEVMDTVAPLAQRKGIEIVCRRPGEALAVNVDRNRLYQVVLNLVSNAIKYNRPQGRVEIGAERRGDRVRLTVTDTGIGLSPSDLARLYTPYTRFGPRHIEGTGIGLTITKRLVEAMGGTIGVDSQVNVGSTFWVEFQRVAAGEVKLTVVAGDAADGPNEGAPSLHGTVLYIEDSVANQMMVRKALQNFPGLNLLTEADPRAGLEKAITHKPDLILLDVTLPEIDGFEVIARLRADLLTRDIPVVGVSANAMQSDIDRAMAAGFDDYLPKPVDIFSLRRLVRLHLQRKAA